MLAPLLFRVTVQGIGLYTLGYNRRQSLDRFSLAIGSR